MVDEFVIAYHEAGHAVLAEQLGGHVLFVTIEPVDDDGPRRHGETQVAWVTNTKRGGRDEDAAFAPLQVALAGPVAEMIYCDEQYEIRVLREWKADWLVAEHTIRTMRPGITATELEQVMRKQLELIIRWMSQDHVWNQVASVADELAAHQTLDEDLLDELRSCGLLGR